MSRLFAITGPRGYTGSVGERGPLGPTGERGEMGRAGPTGPRGFVGEAGPTGPRGVPGRATMTGARGAPGPTGARGEMGERGHTGIMGPTGIRGHTGERGEIGERGPTGQRGIDGIATNTGATGPQGIQGPTGSAGAQGVQGVQGPTGAQGIQGVQGPTGNAGSQGERGPTGAQGIQGPTGAQGIQGIQGVGIIGPTGSQGVQGIQGPTGSTGRTGPAGIQGPTGAQGPAGPAGSGGGMTITTETVAVGGTITASKTVSFLTGQSGGVSYTLGSGTSDGQLKYLITRENPVSWVWDTQKFPSESNNVVSLEVINDSLYMGYINGYISKWNGTQFVVEGHVGKNITSSASVGDIIFYEAEAETVQMYYGPETFTSIYKRSSDGTFSKVTQIGGTLRKIKKVDHRVYFITSYGSLSVYDNMNPSNPIQGDSPYILSQVNIKPYDLEFDSICGDIIVGASTTSPTAYMMAVACTYPPQVYTADGPINGIERVSTNTYCLYGSFNVINGLTTGGIALYNAQTNILKPLGGGINGAVTKVAVKGSDIHIVGSFTGVYQIPGGSLVSMPYMAVWSGNRTGWKPVNGGSSTLATGIRTMKTFGGYLYYGGTFTYVFTPGDSPNLFALGDSVLSYADIEVVGNVLNTYNTASIVLGPPGDSAHLVWNASLSKWCVISPTK